MRIVRFESSDGAVLLGDECGDGTARVLIDGLGLFGPREEERLARATLRGVRALVADDDEGVRRIVAATLQKFDCACTMCRDGAEAIDELGHADFDVVVSDIVMPRHSGYEVFAASKRQRAQRPVVLITGFGYDPGHALVRASDEGVEAVLYKPFTPGKLVETVSDAIRGVSNGCAPALLAGGERAQVSRLLAPAAVGDVLCVGRNYPGPQPMSRQAGDLELFMKPRAALLDPGRAIRLPRFDDGGDAQVACEGELAVVIGREARNVSEADALDHVLGLTAANDVTARRFQSAGIPMAWMRGKGFDTFCPLGPAVVTLDQLDLAAGLEITTTVNGQITRRGDTTQMIRSVPALISEISRRVTLAAGTILLTGAPPRTGPAAESEPSLQGGDEVCIEIEGIGRLVNKVVAP